MEALIPVLSPVVTALVSVFGAYAATKRVTEEHDREQVRSLAKLEAKMDLLTERVDKHNQVVETTYRLEADVTNLYHRYDEVKEALK